MQIVIELPDETYKDIKEENSIYGINNGLSARITGKVVGAIQNGTPLPKGHGRLIDADDLRLDIIGHKYSNNFCEEHNIDWSINLGMLNILLADAPTIIEADKSGR